MFILRNEGLAASPTFISKSVPVSDLCVSVSTSPSLSPFNSDPSTRNFASFVDALDAASSISPVFATLTKNTGGGGTSQETSRRGNGFSPNLSYFNFKLLALSVVEGSTFNSFSHKYFIIRTYANSSRNPCRMNTSKTQDLKRLCLHPWHARWFSRKTGEPQ